MKIIGFRNSTTALRYAVLEIYVDNIEFINADDEHCIKYPKDLDDTSEKLSWLYDEVCRILRKHSDAVCCALKISEYGRSEKKSTRFTSYADAAALIACSKSAKPTFDYIYSQLPTRSSQVKTYSESLAGKSDKYWDNQIADAIAVAYAARRSANE